MISALLPSRAAIVAGIGCLILLPASVFAAYGWGVAHRDRVREAARADSLHEEIYAGGVGYRDRLTACQSNLRGHEAALAIQSQEVQRLAEEGRAATARAQSAIRQAEAKAQQAERRVQSILSAQPRPDEGRCEAALRLIQETVR